MYRKEDVFQVELCPHRVNEEYCLLCRRRREQEVNKTHNEILIEQRIESGQSMVGDRRRLAGIKRRRVQSEAHNRPILHLKGTTTSRIDGQHTNKSNTPKTKEES